MKITDSDHAKGILDFRKALELIDLQRFEADHELSPWIDSYWKVAWDLPAGQEHLQSNISHASVNVVVEDDGVWLYGVPSRIFTRTIAGHSWVFGIKFRPGGFSHFHDKDISAITGRRMRINTLCGIALDDWEMRIREAADDRARVRLCDALLISLKPSRQAVSTEIADLLISDRSAVNISEIVRKTGIEERRLQRIFRTDVGISPKEVVRRFRLQDAAERLLKDRNLSCSDLAFELGYADQAHFTKDFKSVIGRTPGEYQRQQKG
jgi:AraC-like DNA-binding protein